MAVKSYDQIPENDREVHIYATKTLRNAGNTAIRLVVADPAPDDKNIFALTAAEYNVNFLYLNKQPGDRFMAFLLSAAGDDSVTEPLLDTAIAACDVAANPLRSPEVTAWSLGGISGPVSPMPLR